MAIALSDNLQINSNKPADNKYGPYQLSQFPAKPATPVMTDLDYLLSKINQKIVSSYRHKGLTVGVTMADNTISEYWYKAGIADNNLVLKSVSGQGKLTKDIYAIGTSAGAIAEGEYAREGDDMDAFVTQLLQKTIPHAYQQPSVSIVSQPAQLTYERGTLVSPISIQPTFVRRDAGPLTGMSVRRNNQEFSTAVGVSVWNGEILTMSPVDFQAFASYADGVALANNRGIVTPNDPARVLAGVVPSNIITYQGIQPWFYGTSDDQTLTGAQIYAAIAGDSSYTTNKVVENAGASITVPNFRATPGDTFLWVAVPTGGTIYNYVKRSNFDAGPTGDDKLFGSVPIQVTVTSRGLSGTNWTATYDVYISQNKTEPISDLGTIFSRS